MRALGQKQQSVPPPAMSHRSLAARTVENGIVAAAARVFERRGVPNARVEDILDEAGIARKTFYRYFASKEDVLAAVYELATDELLATLDTASLGADPASGVRDVIDLYLQFHVDNRALLRAVLVEAIRPGSALGGDRRRFRAELLGIMVRAAEARGVTPLDGFIYVALVSALEGVALELLDSEAATSEVERAKRALYALVERGFQGSVGASPRPPPVTR